MAMEKSGEICLVTNEKKGGVRGQTRRSLKKMPSAEGVERLAQIYRMFGEPIRLKILLALMNGELCDL